MSIAPGEIGTGRTTIRLKQRVVHECRIADDVGDRRLGMAGREHNPAFYLAYVESIALYKEVIPLAAVIRKVGPVVYILP